MESNGQSTLGKYAQTGMQVIILAVLFWYGDKTVATSDAVIRLEGQVTTLSAIMKIQIRDLDRRIIGLENGN
jgi:hypothetical protein